MLKKIHNILSGFFLCVCLLICFSTSNPSKRFVINIQSGSLCNSVCVNESCSQTVKASSSKKFLQLEIFLLFDYNLIQNSGIPVVFSLKDHSIPSVDIEPYYNDPPLFNELPKIFNTSEAYSGTLVFEVDENFSKENIFLQGNASPENDRLSSYASDSLDDVQIENCPDHL